MTNDNLGELLDADGIRYRIARVAYCIAWADAAERNHIQLGQNDLDKIAPLPVPQRFHEWADDALRLSIARAADVPGTLEDWNGFDSDEIGTALALQVLGTGSGLEDIGEL
jgi:hypothetical protein